MKAREARELCKKAAKFVESEPVSLPILREDNAIMIITSALLSLDNDQKAKVLNEVARRELGGMTNFEQQRQTNEATLAYIATLKERIEELEAVLKSIEKDTRLNSDPQRAHSCHTSFDELLSGYADIADMAQKALGGE
jgi:hypothetical protein